MLTADARLLPQPLAPWSEPGLAISATCSVRPDGAGQCRFEVQGALARIALPEATAPVRADGLWCHTCFEVFVARRGEAAYREFNFSPSGAWAAYDFDDYRRPAAPPAIATPSIGSERTPGRFVLSALTGAGAWPPPGAGALEIALAAVIELQGGELGYYALAHPVARPDFHDRRGFSLTLGRGMPGS